MSFKPFSLLLLFCLWSLACARPIFWKNPCLAQPPLTCYFIPTTGNNVTGIVHFNPFFIREVTTKNRCFVRITASLTGLTPGHHGFHIHTYGDIQTPDGKSAGGHFTDPSGSDRLHGLPGDHPRHWGDFGSIIADEEGKAVYDRVDYAIKLRGITGRGMIIHAMEDMGRSAQPSGGAGARQARCVIGFANPDLLPTS